MLEEGIIKEGLSMHVIIISSISVCVCVHVHACVCVCACVCVHCARIKKEKGER